MCVISLQLNNIHMWLWFRIDVDIQHLWGIHTTSQCLSHTWYKISRVMCILLLATVVGSNWCRPWLISMHADSPNNVVTAVTGVWTNHTTARTDIDYIVFKNDISAMICYYNTWGRIYFLSMFILGGLETKKQAVWRRFHFEWGMCPTGRSIVLYEMALFAFLNLWHEAVSLL